jgi:hypothetical protein
MTSMTTGAPDYASVIADLKRRRDEIEAMIQSLTAIAGNQAVSGAGSVPGEIDATTFYGMTIADASLKYLRIVKRPQAAPDIAAGLERGGLAHESKNFANTVYATLQRVNERNGEIIRLPGRKWGLTADYPDAARRRAAKGQRGDGAATKDEDDDEPTEPEQPDEQPQTVPPVSDVSPEPDHP